MLLNLFPVKHDKYVIKALPKKSIFIHFKTFGMSLSIQKHKHKQNLHSFTLVIYISFKSLSVMELHIDTCDTNKLSGSGSETW